MAINHSESLRFEEDDSRHTWKLTQWFRKMDEEIEKTMQEPNFDHISTLEFDSSGRFLATGDNSGNVVVLENDGPGKFGAPAHFAFFNEFASHWKDYDYVKGETIDPKIMDIKFGPSTNEAVFILVSSEKEIKLWKIQDQEQYTFVDWNIQPAQQVDDDFTFSSAHHPGSKLKRQDPFRDKPDTVEVNMLRSQPIIKKLKIPRKVPTEIAKMCCLKKNYSPRIHEFPISNLGVTADKMNFLSADNLRINLWDFYNPNKSYTLLDVKPDNIQDVSMLITSMDCHPTQSHLFLHTTSIGTVVVSDLRKKAFVDDSDQVMSHKPLESEFYGREENAMEIVEDMTYSVSAAKFSKGGRFIISRDYMSVRIWDVAMPKKPVETIYVHEYLRDKLYEMVSNELLLDSFELGLSSRGDVVTGTYGNYFHILDFGAKKDTFIQAGNHGLKTVNLQGMKNMKSIESGERNNDFFDEPKANKFGGALSNLFGTRGWKHQKQQEHSEADDSFVEEEYPLNLSFEKIDFSKKILRSAWHPQTNTVAVAGENNVYVYGKVPSPPLL